MKKIISSLAVLIIAATLTACAKTENNSEDGVIVSNPFSESGSSEDDLKEPLGNLDENSSDESSSNEDENQTRALCNLLSHGGTLARFGPDDVPYEYNGSPVTIPVTLTANDDNLTEWSVGVMCNINGIMQKLTSGDQTDKTIIIIEDLSPGETVTFDITFDPIVSVNDADKEKIKIAFMTVHNPTFQATEEYISYAGRSVHISTYGDLNMNARPTNIIDPITDSSYEEKLYTSERNYLPSFYRDNPQNIISYLNINSDKSLDFKVTASHLSEGTYYAFILQNNEKVAFNGGKEYMKIDAKEKYEYNLDFHLDKAECGDAVECVFVHLRNYDDDYNMATVLETTRTCLVVREDFTI